MRAGGAAGPTRFAELNDVLADLTRRSSEILGGNFVGAYLQGSFAVGDADMQSDCDFLIPVHGPITAAQEADLRALHDEIPTRPGHWTRHLEGSYPDKTELRTLTGLARPWLYVDHGWREMQWSTHCNSEVARWSLRERGVTLAGPDPKTLVDPVPAGALAARMRQDAATFMTDLATWISLDVAWGQRYAVATLSRILTTHDEGCVVSKRAALLWAKEHTEPHLADLLQQVLDDRDLGFDVDQAARPGSVEQTRAYADYVTRRLGAAGTGA